MAGFKPTDGLREGFPPERHARVKANAVRQSDRPRAGAARLTESEVREREAVLDALVADAQENDMGYRRD